jgi:hypothetical protein
MTSKEKAQSLFDKMWMKCQFSIGADHMRFANQERERTAELSRDAAQIVCKEVIDELRRLGMATTSTILIHSEQWWREVATKIDHLEYPSS